MIYVGWASSILWTNKKLNTLNLYDANDSTSVQFLLLLFSPCQTTTLDDHPLVKWYIISYYCHCFLLSSRLHWPKSWLFNKYSQKNKNINKNKYAFANWWSNVATWLHFVMLQQAHYFLFLQRLTVSTSKLYPFFAFNLFVTLSYDLIKSYHLPGRPFFFI